MKDKTFKKYLTKRKFRGSYTSEVSEDMLNEGLGDFLKKGWYKTKKTLSGSNNDKDVILYSVTGDFSDKAFAEAVAHKVEGEPTLEDVKKVVSSTVEQVVGLARGKVTERDTGNVEADEDDQLYTSAPKGYKYSWVQNNKLFVYFDNYKSADEFLNQRLIEQKRLEVDAATVKKMFSLEKYNRSKSLVYDKVQSEKRHYKKGITLEHAKFDDECAKEVVKMIEKLGIGNEEEVPMSVYAVNWKIDENTVKDMLTNNAGASKSANNLEMIFTSKIFDVVKDLAVNTDGFCYAGYRKDGSVNLCFKNEAAAEAFVNDFNGLSSTVGTVSDIEKGRVNGKNIKNFNKDNFKPGRMYDKVKKIAVDVMDTLKKNRSDADTDGKVWNISIKVDAAALEKEFNKTSDKNAFNNKLSGTQLFTEKFNAFGRMFSKIMLNELTSKKPSTKAAAAAEAAAKAEPAAEQDSVTPANKKEPTFADILATVIGKIKSWLESNSADTFDVSADNVKVVSKDNMVILQVAGISEDEANNIASELKEKANFKFIAVSSPVAAKYKADKLNKVKKKTDK